MKRTMALVLGMGLTSATLSAQSGAGVAPHVAILKTQLAFGSMGPVRASA